MEETFEQRVERILGIVYSSLNFDNSGKSIPVKVNEITYVIHENTESIEIIPELTYGQRLVGARFNPSNLSNVDTIKQKYAEIIDFMDGVRSNSTNQEQKRLASIAITEAQGAQMWAVKAVTWKD